MNMTKEEIRGARISVMQVQSPRSFSDQRVLRHAHDALIRDHDRYFRGRASCLLSWWNNRTHQPVRLGGFDAGGAWGIPRCGITCVLKWTDGMFRLLRLGSLPESYAMGQTHCR